MTNIGDRMKRTVLVLLALALLAAACGSTATPAPGPKLTAPWGTGDRAEYSVAVNGQQVAVLVLSTAPGTGGGYIFTTETSAGTMKDTSKARVDDNLRPAGVTREVTGAGDADFALMSVYNGKGKLSIEAKTAQGTKAMTIDVPVDCWDNDQSLFTMRALPLTENYTTTFTIAVGATAAVVKTQLAVLGKERIDAPAGSFSTYKVEMSVDGAKLYAWYDTSLPHHLIKYESTGKAASGEITQTIMLTKIGL
jgi:hypothetical protein